MPLTNPPQMLVNGAWRTTEWDESVSAMTVQNGERSIGPRDVAAWRWTIALNREPPRVARLRVAGPSSPLAAQAGALVLPVGRYPVVGLVEQDGDRREFDAGIITVRAT